MSIIPMPPGATGGEDEGELPGAEKGMAGDADQATRPFEEVPDVEQEQARGMATPDPEKGAP